MALKDLIVRGPKPPMPARAELRREPMNIDAENWFYEEKRGIRFVHEVRTANAYIRTDQILIPWKALEQAVERRRIYVECRGLRTKHGPRTI